ncbi:hypothetical protein J2T17_006374 [Paenibacillus mucilaginosus]|uniref:FixH family protein n=1 Tax=Paenibacillus mucilaginosus TaxID=61624 RepID=UPI003D1CEF80
MWIRKVKLNTGCIMILLLLLLGCASNPQGTNPAAVKVNLLTDPPTVQTSKPIKLKAEVIGIDIAEDLQVQFDIRKPNRNALPDLLEAKLEDGQFVTEKTFEQTGTYTVYIHVYQGELHITKKKELTVS